MLQEGDVPKKGTLQRCHVGHLVSEGAVFFGCVLKIKGILGGLAHTAGTFFGQANGVAFILDFKAEEG